MTWIFSSSRGPHAKRKSISSEKQDWGWMNEPLGLTDVHEGLKHAHIHIVEGQAAPTELAPRRDICEKPKSFGQDRGGHGPHRGEK